MSIKERKHTEIKANESKEEIKKLILWNDDVNSFDHVIECLVEVCEHNPMQAETCAWIAHFKGKCPVKSGPFNLLKPLYSEMTNRKLTVEII